MFVYAGIDEAGYGPMFGPLTLGRAVFGVPGLPAAAPPPDLWRCLRRGVCRKPARRGGRIAVNDSKKLYSPGAAAGLRHLELGVLTFARLLGRRPADVGQWLDAVGETAHRGAGALPWYAPEATRPWQPVPAACSPDQVAIAGNVLGQCLKAAGVEMLDLGAAVVFEDRFNRMVAATRSKASVSFTFVGGHLLSVWERFGEHGPLAVVDRQSGRAHYRELLALTFPGTHITVLEESETRSAYRIEACRGEPRGARPEATGPAAPRRRGA